MGRKCSLIYKTDIMQVRESSFSHWAPYFISIWKPHWRYRHLKLWVKFFFLFQGKKCCIDPTGSPYSIDINPNPWCISKQKIMMSPQMLQCHCFQITEAEKQSYRNQKGQNRIFFNLFFPWRTTSKAIQFAIIMFVSYIAYQYHIRIA